MMADNKYTITRRKQLVAAVGLAVIGLLGLQLTNDIDYDNDSRRQLQQDDVVVDVESNQHRAPRRRLARNGPSPIDVADSSYVIKPNIGHAVEHIYETQPQTKLNPPMATASSQVRLGVAGNVLDGLNTTFWKSNTIQTNVAEYLTLDLGILEHINQIQIQFAERGDVSFKLQLSEDDIDYIDAEIKWSFKQLSFTFVNGPYGPARYVRFKFFSGYTGIDPPPQRRLTEEKADTTEETLSAVRKASRASRERQLQQEAPYYSVSFVNVWREKRVLRSPRNEDLELCGATVEAVKNKLIGRNGGSLITVYENAEYFTANMSPAVAASMVADPCAFAVEPNYIVRARGTRTARRLGGGASEKNLDPTQEVENKVPQQEIGQVPQEASIQVPQEAPREDERRRLGIPEFNLEDDEPGNWGLERISTRGKRNGKYIWVHDGFDIDVYIFDTAIYPDHSDWTGRNVTYGNLGPSRLEEHFVCVGDELDYGAADDHGTFMASIAAGKKYGTAKMSTIHPMQVLDPATGEGSLASILCGVDKLIQDGIDYNLAHAPKQIRAVVNFSLGTDGRSDILDRIALDLTRLGYTVVIAAGDDGGNACHYSPNTSRAIRVGAVKDAGIYSGANEKTSTSNYGECIDIWAPGELIQGATNTGEYDTTTMSGTSVAAAFTTGVATMFLGQILTYNTPQTRAYGFADIAKEKMLNQGEKDVLGNIGHKSVDRILQTTSSACQTNAHCDPPLTCLYDGVCGNLADYFWK